MQNVAATAEQSGQLKKTKLTLVLSVLIFVAVIGLATMVWLASIPGGITQLNILLVCASMACCAIAVIRALTRKRYFPLVLLVVLLALAFGGLIWLHAPAESSAGFLNQPGPAMAYLLAILDTYFAWVVPAIFVFAAFISMG